MVLILRVHNAEKLNFMSIKRHPRQNQDYKNSNGSIVIRNANDEKFLNSYNLVIQVDNHEIVKNKFISAIT